MKIALSPPPSPSPRGLCRNVIARERNDRAISQGIDISEIATLPRITCGVARNDREGIGATPPEARGWVAGFSSFPRVRNPPRQTFIETSSWTHGERIWDRSRVWVVKWGEIAALGSTLVGRGIHIREAKAPSKSCYTSCQNPSKSPFAKGRL